MNSFLRICIIITVAVIAVGAGLGIATLATPRIPSTSVMSMAAPATTSVVAAVVLPTAALPLATRTQATSLAVAPTLPASPTALITPTSAPSDDQILPRVRAAINALASGRLDAVLDYGDGNNSVANVLFELGQNQRAPALHINTVYHSAAGERGAQRVTIGDQVWDRQESQAWVAGSAQESVSGQLEAFLPHIGADAQVANEAELIAISWADPAAQLDLTLLVDPITGIPRNMRQLDKTTGLTLTVSYSGWNEPVEIKAPV